MKWNTTSKLKRTEPSARIAERVVSIFFCPVGRNKIKKGKILVFDARKIEKVMVALIQHVLPAKRLACLSMKIQNMELGIAAVTQS